jgi:large subunit ribosomal protein L18
MKKSIEKRQNRQKRVRLKLKDNLDRPRLHVYRSNRHLYAQIIDDSVGKTVTAVSDSEIKTTKLTKTQIAQQLGALIAQKASAKKIVKVKFDRGSYQYHGRVKALAEAARKGGLEF